MVAHFYFVAYNSFINENKLRYPEIKSSQDVVFAWKSYLLAKRVSAIEDVCYNHMRRQNSMTGSRGKLKANAILSASLLYCVEIEQIIAKFHFDNSIFIRDLQFEIKCSVNDDSRKVLMLKSNEREMFYGLLRSNIDAILLIQPYMNRKTKNIFNYHLPYCLWFCMIKVYHFLERVRK